MTAVLEEVGLDAKTGWYASILLYGAAGLATAGLYLLLPDHIPVGVFVLAMVAILLSVLSIYGARHLSNANWATHMRLAFGLAIILVGAVVAGPSRVAFVLLPLFVLVTPAFLYGARFAIPYAAVVTTVMFVVLIDTPGPARTAHASVAVGAVWMIVLSFMVAEQATRRLARLNRMLAYTDALTGIANMRRLRDSLVELLAARHENAGAEPFALFAIDLDNFKRVNDEFDHGMGDRVLQAVAQELTSEADALDIVARRGGDEFSVLVLKPDRRDLDALARRLSGAIVRARVRTCPQVTPSGTVAYVPVTEDDTVASVLRRADDALHDAKRAFHLRSGESPVVDATPEFGLDEEPSSAVAERRRASFDRVAAAVGRAYAPRRPRAGADIERRFGTLREWWAGLNPLWSFSALALMPAGFTLLVLTSAGLLHPLPTHVGLLCGLGYFVLSGIGIWAGGHDWREEVMHLGFVVAILLTVWAAAEAGPAGAALIDILAVLALYAIYFLGPRQALPYLLGSMVAYSALAIAGDYAFGLLRAGITDTVVLVAAGLIAKIRGVTVRFARTNAELSEIDSLTGLANVRALGFRVADAVNRARHHGFVPAILTIDLDEFKLVNDRYSHSVGDHVIESVARAISETVRVDELVARRGGDEFFVLFERSDEDHVGAVADRLYDAISHARLRICPDLPATTSIGMVSWREGDTAVQFLARADRAMHDEKLRSTFAEKRRSA